MEAQLVINSALAFDKVNVDDDAVGNAKVSDTAIQFISTEAIPPVAEWLQQQQVLFFI